MSRPNADVYRHNYDKSQQHDGHYRAIYRHIYPGKIRRMDPATSVADQCGGVDRIIELDDGRRVRWEEKIRFRQFTDVLLEFQNSRVGRPGWVNKPQHNDAVLYLILPRELCYLLPGAALRRAWNNNGEQWKQRRVVKSGNDPNDLSVAVGWDELNRAMRNTGKRLDCRQIFAGMGKENKPCQLTMFASLGD